MLYYDYSSARQQAFKFPLNILQTVVEKLDGSEKIKWDRTCKDIRRLFPVIEVDNLTFEDSYYYAYWYFKINGNEYRVHHFDLPKLLSKIVVRKKLIIEGCLSHWPCPFGSIICSPYLVKMLFIFAVIPVSWMKCFAKFIEDVEIVDSDFVSSNGAVLHHVNALEYLPMLKRITWHSPSSYFFSKEGIACLINSGKCNTLEEINVHVIRSSFDLDALEKLVFDHPHIRFCLDFDNIGLTNIQKNRIMDLSSNIGTCRGVVKINGIDL